MQSAIFVQGNVTEDGLDLINLKASADSSDVGTATFEITLFNMQMYIVMEYFMCI